MEFIHEFHGLMAPIIILFIICSIFGCIGNITVIYVFALRYRKNHFRLLVLAISIVDFTGCCTTVPMETISTWFWFDAPSAVFCKAKNVFFQFTGLSAIYMLFVMAVFKYRLICKPLCKQLTQRILITICCFGLVISLAIAAPAVYLWDVNNYTVTADNVTYVYYVCEVQRRLYGTAYPRIYRHIVTAYDILLLTTIVLYIHVAKKIIQHKRQMNIHKNDSVAVLNPLSASIVSKRAEMTDVDCSNVTDLDFRSDFTGNSSAQRNQDKADARQYKVMTPDNVKQRNTSLPKPSAVSSSSSQLTAVQIRKVIIMAILSGTFAVTFMLGQVVGYYFAVRGFEDYASLRELQLLFTMDRLYFINYALNPLVYFTLDRHFRKETITLFQFLRNT